MLTTTDRRPALRLRRGGCGEGVLEPGPRGGTELGKWGVVGGGVTVVTVSRGSEVLGAAVGRVGPGVAITVRVGGGPTTVAVVVPLSPPFTIRAVAITASTSTPAPIAATGRHR